LQKALIYAVHADKEPKELHNKCGEIKIKVQRNQNHERPTKVHKAKRKRLVINPVELQHEVGKKDQKNADITDKIIPIVTVHEIHLQPYLL